jgi:hypothetical protein
MYLHLRRKSMKEMRRQELSLSGVKLERSIGGSLLGMSNSGVFLTESSYNQHTCKSSRSIAAVICNSSSRDNQNNFFNEFVYKFCVYELLILTISRNATGFRDEILWLCYVKVVMGLCYKVMGLCDRVLGLCDKVTKFCYKVIRFCNRVMGLCHKISRFCFKVIEFCHKVLRFWSKVFELCHKVLRLCNKVLCSYLPNLCNLRTYFVRGCADFMDSCEYLPFLNGYGRKSVSCCLIKSELCYGI